MAGYTLSRYPNLRGRMLPERTTCAIAGGGPAGLTAGYLLARAGLDVVVLEKHADFLRDFRGDTIHHDERLDEFTHVVSRAAAAIAAIDRSSVAWREKPDRSPVSAADEAANAVIVQGLSRLLPGVPVVSEEEHMKPSGLDDALFS